MFKPLEERVEQEIGLGRVSDVCFGAGPSEEVKLFSSRATLAIASPVFQTMLFAEPWTNKAPPPADGAYDPNRHMYVAITDVEPSALRCMLRYVHHLEPNLSLDNSLHVYRAADKYQIEGLRGACDAFLVEHADPRDVEQMLRLFDIACRLGIERYASCFLDKLAELSRLQTRRLLGADEFLALHPASMATLLGSDGLCVDEEPLWLALRRWAELRAAAPLNPCACAGVATDAGGGAENPAAGPPSEAEGRLPRPELSPEATETPSEWQVAGLGTSAVRWQEVLRPLKRLIRFPAMDAGFFAREAAQSGVLSAEEAVGIFCYLSCRKGGEGESGDGVSTLDAFGAADDDDPPQVLVADHFRAEPRAPRLGFCGAPGPSGESPPSEECGFHNTASSTAIVVDGRGLCPGPWGNSIVLGSTGSGFHFAFGSRGFSSGRHAWTISWRPLDSSRRGGAAGIAREADVSLREKGGAVTASATSCAAALGAVLGAATPRDSSTAGPPKTGGGGFGSALGGAGGRMGTLALGGVVGAGFGAGGGVAAGGGDTDPAARFLDWPTCFVFGFKRDVSERRYVAWDVPEEGVSEGACVRFAIVLDFDTRIVTYIADRWERCWTAPLAHTGTVYPVIAASGPHHFRIQYGTHL